MLVVVVVTLSILGRYQHISSPMAAPIVHVNKLRVVTIESLNAQINKVRSDGGLQPLTESPLLDESASEKANEMIAEGEQPNPHLNKSGIEGYTKVFRHMPSCKYASENLIMYSDDRLSSTEAAVQAWMNSPAHRDAILKPDARYVGYAIVGRFVVQHFCVL